MFDELFDMSASAAAELFLKIEMPEQIFDLLDSYISTVGESLDRSVYERVGEGVWIAKNAELADSAHISPPCIVGEGAQLRHGAFIRGSVIVGRGCIIGNSSEVKSSILFDGVKLPHFNYVGDSVLGRDVHFGAGAIVSNLKSTASPIRVASEHFRAANRRKLGALIGDRAQLGCSAVVCPGSVIGRESIIYPLSLVRGGVPSRSIYKSDSSVVPIEPDIGDGEGSVCAE